MINNRSIYILKENSSGNINSIDILTYNYSPEKLNFIKYSPQLTKLIYLYYDTDIGETVIAFKNIDYDNYYTYDMELVESQNVE